LNQAAGLTALAFMSVIGVTQPPRNAIAMASSSATDSAMTTTPARIENSAPVSNAPSTSQKKPIPPMPSAYMLARPSAKNPDMAATDFSRKGSRRRRKVMARAITETPRLTA
jgi:hypothetical protein